MCNCDLSMMVVLQVQRKMTFTEKTEKKLTWHIQMSIRLMTIICNLSKSWWNPVYMHLFKNHIWSIWWSCLLMVLLYISIWCPLMYTMTASWSVLTHLFVHPNKNECKKKKKKTNKSISIHSQLSCLVSSISGPVLH